MHSLRQVKIAKKAPEATTNSHSRGSSQIGKSPGQVGVDVLNAQPAQRSHTGVFVQPSKKDPRGLSVLQESSRGEALYLNKPLSISVTDLALKPFFSVAGRSRRRPLRIYHSQQHIYRRSELGPPSRLVAGNAAMLTEKLLRLSREKRLDVGGLNKFQCESAFSDIGDEPPYGPDVAHNHLRSILQAFQVLPKSNHHGRGLVRRPLPE